jgi:hypothetical protein
MRTVLFYVSGHGYGHIVRMAEVMRALRSQQPEWRILARTQAPKFMVPDDVEHSSAEFESGVVESQVGLVIDEAATVEKLKCLLLRWDSVVDSEAAFVVQNGVDLVVADVPPIAGDIAHAAGVRCFAISNFTWDWIYEPYTREHLGRLESGYRHMDALLRLPFAQQERVDTFRRVIDAPLIARASGTGIQKPERSRKRVLLGSRAQVSDAALARAKLEGPEFEFIAPPVGPDFPEALASCDLVLAKLGFGIAADCIAGHKPILFPPRPNFREETILQAEVPQHVPAIRIPLDEFYAGAWAPYLRQLMATPPVISTLETTGASFCAEFIWRELLG